MTFHLASLFYLCTHLRLSLNQSLEHLPLIYLVLSFTYLTLIDFKNSFSTRQFMFVATLYPTQTHFSTVGQQICDCFPTNGLTICTAFTHAVKIEFENYEKIIICPVCLEKIHRCNYAHQSIFNVFKKCVL